MAKLPEGVVKSGPDYIVTPSKAYPPYIEMAGLETGAFAAEVARRCLVQDLISIGIEGVIRIVKDEDWRLVDLPGGAEEGEKGRVGFRPYYDKLIKARADSVLRGGGK